MSVPGLVPPTRGVGRARPIGRSREKQFFLCSGHGYKELSAAVVLPAPEQLTLNSEHDDLFELETLALVDGEDPNRILLRQASESSEGIAVFCEFRAERVDCLRDDLVEALTALIVR